MKQASLPEIDYAPDGIARTATISACGTYRLELRRVWDAALPLLVWNMLNPSDADAERDDPTLHQVMTWSRRLGFGGALVINLADYRTPHPSALPSNMYAAVSPDADQAITAAFELARASGWAMAAWGNVPRPGWWQDRIARVRGLAQVAGVELRCLGRTMHGHPKHPLARGRHRIPADLIPVAWP